MSSIVVDASALIRALAVDTRDELLRRRLRRFRRIHAAAHVGAEVFNGIRGLTLAGKLSERRAEQAIEDFLDLPISRHTVESLAVSVWQLRQNFNAYDGAYVAVAQRLGLPLLTCDEKIGKSAPKDVEVHVYPQT